MSTKITSFILDASVALAWCFGDEQTESTRQLLQSLETGTAFVPSLWTLEVGNILISAERRKRISYSEINCFLGLLEQLNIKIDNQTADRGFHEILAHAFTQNLTTYDAAYLELAMRMGLPLASKDKKLCEVAIRLGTEVITI